MKALDFRLQPFRSAGTLPRVKVAGRIARDGNSLAIHYAVHGALANMVIPDSVERPTRKHGLWKESCFEFFVAVRDASRYWEFNLSPSGHWNVYRFTGYREGMREERSFASLPFKINLGPGTLSLTLECSLDSIIPPAQAVDLALCAVIKHTDGPVTYWALTHRGPQPDFHLRDGFLITLSGSV